MFSLHFSRTTWALVLTALVLGGVVYVVEGVIPQQQRRQDAARSRLFPDLEVAQIRRIIVTTPDDRIVLQQSRTQNLWRMTEPERAIANAATVSFLTNILTEGQRQQQLEVAPEDLGEYGLDEPIAAITVDRRGEIVPMVLVLGQLSFDEQSIYVYRRTDDPFQAMDDSTEAAEPPASITVFLAPIELRYAIARDLSEWIDRDRTEDLES